MSMCQLCKAIGVPHQTLSSWKTHRRKARGGRLRRPCGRPRKDVPRSMRREITEQLAEVNGRISVAELRQCFPGVPARVLGSMREAWRAENPAHPNRLHWTQSGAVWVLDYSHAEALIEERYPYFLSVRDAASKMHLMVYPTEHDTASVTAACLQWLFARHGPPLVIKSDNGGHFTAHAVESLLQEHRVAHLRSPTRTPQYNGSSEAGINASKTRLRRYLIEHAPAAQPLLEDIETMRIEANHSVRPWGRNGPTPAERWDQRPPVTRRQRAAFMRDVDRRHERALVRSLAELDPVRELNELERATVARSAIRGALIASRLLIIRRRSNSSCESNRDLAEN